MKLGFSAALLAATMGAAGMFLPAVAQAALVGHKNDCRSGGDTAAMIVAAGHTPVAVATVDATSLSGLAAFVYEGCLGTYVSGAAVDAAVADGMVLVIHFWDGAMTLPGGISPSANRNSSGYLLLPVGSPALTGPGGTLSTGRAYFSFAQNGFLPSGLPQGSTTVATSYNSPNVVTFAYNYGRGLVAASTVRLSYILYSTTDPNVRKYTTNLIAWAVASGFRSCAAEGYAGSRLTLCRQVCEIEQTPARLLSLIRLYKTAYREDPPCSR